MQRSSFSFLWSASVLALSSLVACGDDGTTGGGGSGGDGGSATGGAPEGGGGAGTGGGGAGTGGEGGEASLPQSLMCVGSVEWGTSAVKQIAVTGTLRAITGSELADVTITACAADDGACENPIDTHTTAADGSYTLIIPVTETGFDGYFEVLGEGILSDLIARLPPLVEDVSAYDFVEIAVVQYDGFIDAVDEVRDPQKGQLAVTVLNCGEELGAEGVEVTVEGSDAPLYYLTGQSLDASATVTDESGFALLVNAEPGDYTVVARYPPTGDIVGTWPVTVRADFVTSLFLPPTP